MMMMMIFSPVLNVTLLKGVNLLEMILKVDAWQCSLNKLTSIYFICYLLQTTYVGSIQLDFVAKRYGRQ